MKKNMKNFNKIKKNYNECYCNTNKVKSSNFKIPEGIVHFTNLMRAFLGADPQCTVEYNRSTKTIDVTVTGCAYKTEAIASLLRARLSPNNPYSDKKNWIRVNGDKKTYTREISQETILTALNGNPFFKNIIVAEFEGTKRWFAQFEPKVVQVPTDNFGDYYGFESFLAQDFIKYIFEPAAFETVAWTTARSR